jgi:hypothetical protein
VRLPSGEASGTSLPGGALGAMATPAAKGDALMRWISGLITIAGLYGLYRLLRPSAPAVATSPAAFSDKEAVPENATQIRNAGPEATATLPEEWDEVDQASDESFPASDPGAKY